MGLMPHWNDDMLSDAVTEELEIGLSFADGLRYIYEIVAALVVTMLLQTISTCCVAEFADQRMHWLIHWLSIVMKSLLDCFAKISDDFDVVDVLMAFILLRCTQISPVEIIGSLD